MFYSSGHKGHTAHGENTMSDYDYRGDLKRVEREVPSTARTILIIILAIMLLGAVTGVVGWGLGLFSEAGQVAKQELGAKALLKKYEWFKTVSAELDAKRANIEIMKGRQTAMMTSYGSTPRAKWDRTDKEQFNLWEQEVAGTIANYNGLAAEYNAQMAKANWAFTNVGSLPQGADKALPREYRTYVTN